MRLHPPLKLQKAGRVIVQLTSLVSALYTTLAGCASISLPRSRSMSYHKTKTSHPQSPIRLDVRRTYSSHRLLSLHSRLSTPRTRTADPDIAVERLLLHLPNYGQPASCCSFFLLPFAPRALGPHRRFSCPAVMLPSWRSGRTLDES